METVTQWFDGEVKPVHAGVYEVLRKGVVAEYPEQSFLRWNGYFWCHTEHSSSGRFAGSKASMGRRDVWRGLAEKPKSA